MPVLSAAKTMSETDRIKLPCDAAETGKVPTADGSRLEIEQLNVGEENDPNQPPPGILGRIHRAVSLFLAGMYTGVKCSGIPHSHHTYDRDDRPL